MKQQHDRGFLFIEVAIILGLLLVIIGLCLPQLQFLHRTCVAFELEKLRQFFLFCSARAVASGKQEVINFAEAQQRYSCGQYSETLAASVMFGFLPAMAGPPSKPTTIITRPISYDNQQVIFYPDGTMQSGSVYLTDRNKSCCYALTSPVSSVAYLRKYHYLNNTWSLIQ